MKRFPYAPICLSNLSKSRTWVHVITLIIVAAGVFGWLTLSVDKDLLAVFPKDNSEVKTMQKVKHQFERGGRLLILMEANEVDEEGLAERTDSLAAVLKKSDLISSVLYRPLWEEDKEQLADVLAYMWLNGNSSEVDNLIQKTSEKELQNTIDEVIEELGVQLDPSELALLARDPLGLMRHQDLKKLAEQKQPGQGEGVESPFRSANGKARLMIVYPASVEQSSGAWCSEVKLLVDEWESTHGKGVSLNLTGGPAFASEIASNVRRDIMVTVLISAIFSGLIFWVLVRDSRLIHFQVLLVACILGTTYGIGGLLFGSMSLMSVGFASILIGLAVDYGMIICTEGKHMKEEGELRKAVTKPIVFSSLSTAAVFGSLCFSVLPGIQELGFLVGVGIILSAFILLTYYVPKVCQQKSCARDGSKNVEGKRIERQCPRILKLGLISVMLLVIIPLFVIGVPKVKFDLHVMTSGHSSAKLGLERVKQVFPERFGEDELSVVLEAGNTAQMREILIFLQEVDKGETQGNSVAAILYPSLVRQQKNLSKLEELATSRESILNVLKENGFKEESIRLNAHVLSKVGMYSEVAKSGKALFLQHQASLAWAGAFIDFEVVAGEGAVLLQIPASLWEKVIGHEEFPKYAAFLEATSWQTIESSISEQLPKDLLRVLIFVAILTLVMLYSAIKSVRDTVVGVACLLVPIGLVSLMVSYSSLEWNFLNIFAIPLLLGMGVDYVIHMIFAYRRSFHSGGMSRLYIQRTLLCCGSTSVVGFFALGASSSKAFVSLGILCGCGVIFTMLFCLIVMPMLLGQKVRE